MAGRNLKTPLRYPGGKSRLTPFILEILSTNNIKNGTYIEPFAGGAGIAINLLLDNHVGNICLNDKDRSIYAFWNTLLNETDWLINKIRKTTISVEEWKKQKEIQQLKDTIELKKLGFSTLFLNRTNRSGILRAGVIGGINQNGNYKINARFNKEQIISKIQAIADKKNDISFYNLDVLDFIEQEITSKDIDNTLIYFDPPYVNKGCQLYMNYYKHDDHIILAEQIKQLSHKWIVSYDDVQLIRELYQDQSNSKNIQLRYSAGNTNLGQEVIFSSNNIILP